MNDEEWRALWRDAEHDEEAKVRLAVIQSRLGERSRYAIPVVMRTSTNLCDLGDKGILLEFSTWAGESRALVLVPRLKRVVSVDLYSFEVDDSFLEG